MDWAFAALAVLLLLVIAVTAYAAYFRPPAAPPAVSPGSVWYVLG